AKLVQGLYLFREAHGWARAKLVQGLYLFREAYGWANASIGIFTFLVFVPGTLLSSYRETLSDISGKMISKTLSRSWRICLM
ncbi:MAG: hypothetical protein OEY07_09375, partial [Gammaproteobacteria bacterium]|nr:hypothetical protein [Gammaproteobacteria bacterium]